jgi:23S rRNA maturation-related 3'-5' exoribonuclease YhaM
MKEFFLSDCGHHENKIITSTFVVVSKQVKPKKSGEPYLALILGDRTGQLEAKMWDNVEDAIDAFEQDDFLKIKGLLNKYKNRFQITIHKLRRLGDSEIDFSDYLPKTTKDIGELWQTLATFIASFRDPHLKALVEAFMSDPEIAEPYRNAPAAKTLHHAYIGGLLDHVVSLCRSCDLMCQNYPQINRDLLLTGAFLHDIGKIHELTYNRSFSYTTRGQLLGHMIIELEMLQAGRALDHQPSWGIRIRLAEAAHVSRGSDVALSRQSRFQDGKHAGPFRTRSCLRWPLDRVQFFSEPSAIELSKVSGKEEASCRLVARSARPGVADGGSNRGTTGGNQRTVISLRTENHELITDFSISHA